MKNNKKAQVWIETVLYTIVGLTIIGIVLGFVMPKINQTRDNAIVEQSINAMKDLDAKIKDVSRQQGNIGRIDFNIKRGYIYINASNDSIVLGIEDLTSLYSESGAVIVNGPLQIESLEGQKKNSVFITLRYEINITYSGFDGERKLTAAKLPYKIFIENKGNKQIDITGG